MNKLINNIFMTKPKIYGHTICCKTLSIHQYCILQIEFTDDISALIILIRS